MTWKANVRKRHRLHMRPKSHCEQCGGRRGGVDFHHDWENGTPGAPPKPVSLCRHCHDALDGAKPSQCPICGRQKRSFEGLKIHAKRAHRMAKRALVVAMEYERLYA